MNGIILVLKRALSRNQALTALAWVFVITALVEWVVLDLSQLGALVLFLFLVITSAYYFSLALSLLVSVLAYLLLNYLVVEPRYSLHVPDPKSWIVLVGFMVTSLRVNSLVHTLKMKTKEAEVSAANQHFARLISESLLQRDTVESALQAVIQVLQSQSGVQCEVQELPADLSTDPKGTQVFGSLDSSGNPVWLMPILSADRGLSRYLNVSTTQGQADYLVLENLQLACNQLNACIARIESVSQMQQAQLQAREEEVRSHLLASLSHDMRTPLTAIMGAATSLSSQFEQLSELEIRQLIRSIEAESFHLASSSENVLSLVKLRSLTTLPEPLGWQSPIEIIEATVRRYELRRQERVFMIQSAPDPFLFRADAILISQALANLIDNACAVHRGTEPIVIAVASEVHADSHPDSAYVRMTVLDRGPGFPEDFTAQDIRAFKAPSKSLRLGLGLAIVQAIVSLHQGNLQIQARPGGGASVSMIFRAQHPQVDSHEL